MKNFCRIIKKLKYKKLLLFIIIFLTSIMIVNGLVTNDEENIINDDFNNEEVEKKDDESKNDYDYSNPVPLSDNNIDNNYFSDAVFIGDSRTEGLLLSTGLYNAISYTHKGLMVDTVFTSPVITKNGNKLSVIEALKQTEFNKVYIMLGINETGWPYSNIFIEKYNDIINEIKNINPKAIIYVQSVLPVTNSVSNSHSYIKNSKIDEFNTLIKKMAEEQKIYYLDVASAVSLNDGSLPEEAATDGIHLNKEYCEKWLEYLKKHVVLDEVELNENN